MKSHVQGSRRNCRFRRHRVISVHALPCVPFVIVALLFGGCVPSSARGSKDGPQATAPTEKESRTPAQRKIDSQLLYEIYREQGIAAQKQVPPGDTRVRIDEKKRALVDVRAPVTSALFATITKLDGTVLSSSRDYNSTIAWIPLLKLEQIAEDPAVRAIQPAAEATTHGTPTRK